MDALKLYEDALDDLASDLITEDEFTEIIKCLRNVQEVKHGHWVNDGFDIPNGVNWCHCSVCGGHRVNVPNDKTPYCPWCGAKMDEEV